jgi:competence protein ComEA
VPEPHTASDDPFVDTVEPAAGDAAAGAAWSPEWRDRVALLAGAGGGSPLVARVAAGVGVAAVVALVIALRAPAAEPPELTMPVAPAAPASATPTTETPAPDVYAHAAGAVGRPGVYRLGAGARVTDLIAAAGGAAPDADLDRLNLAAPVTDGQRVYVPRVGEEPPAEATVDAADPGGEAGAGALIDINAADRAALESLPGIGPATAQAILDERSRRGVFRSVDELLEVRGIGPAKLAAIRDRVRV